MFGNLRFLQWHLAPRLVVCGLIFFLGHTADAAPLSVAPPADLVPSALPLADPGLSTLWDVNSDGINDFNFNFRQPQTVGGLDWQANVFPVNGAGIIGNFDPSFNFYVTRMTLGNTVGSSNTFLSSPVQGIFAENFNTVAAGNFLPPNQRGFLGFSISTGSNVFYGYLDLQVARSTGGGVYGIDFISATYETTPSTTVTVAPEPGTFGALAAGVLLLAGVGRWRRNPAKQWEKR